MYATAFKLCAAHGAAPGRTGESALIDLGPIVTAQLDRRISKFAKLQHFKQAIEKPCQSGRAGKRTTGASHTDVVRGAQTPVAEVALHAGFDLVNFVIAQVSYCQDDSHANNEKYQARCALNVTDK